MVYQTFIGNAENLYGEGSGALERLFRTFQNGGEDSKAKARKKLAETIFHNEYLGKVILDKAATPDNLTDEQIQDGYQIAKADFAEKMNTTFEQNSDEIINAMGKPTLERLLIIPDIRKGMSTSSGDLDRFSKYTTTSKVYEDFKANKALSPQDENQVLELSIEGYGEHLLEDDSKHKSKGTRSLIKALTIRAIRRGDLDGDYSGLRQYANKGFEKSLKDLKKDLNEDKMHAALRGAVTSYAGKHPDQAPAAIYFAEKDRLQEMFRR